MSADPSDTESSPVLPGSVRTERRPGGAHNVTSSHLLERQEYVVGAIVDELPLGQSTVSQHPELLEEAGLIHCEVDGPRISYCADPDRLERLRALLGGILTPEHAAS